MVVTEESDDLLTGYGRVDASMCAGDEPALFAELDMLLEQGLRGAVLDIAHAGRPARPRVVRAA